jgi:8-oxo-dGTP diphosphatase
MKTLEVVAGVVIKEGRVLIAQKRSDHKVIPGKWEFPGGRTDGQPHNLALKRELREEMDGFEVGLGRYIGKFVHSYDGKTLIELHAYLCIPRNNPNPLEHERIEWVEPNSLIFYDLAIIDKEVASTLIVKGIN